jgi:predicted ferric reductase
VGAKARVEGPFGRFERNSKSAQEIWIAAGIGITPFVAWAEALTSSDKPVVLFYCIKDQAQAAHLDELTEIAKKLPNFTLQVHQSKKQGRIDAGTIANAVSDISNANVYFCGPKGLRNMLVKELGKLGVNSRKFHFEEFEIRSGIGLRKLATWVLIRAKNRI